MRGWLRGDWQAYFPAIWHLADTLMLFAQSVYRHSFMQAIQRLMVGTLVPLDVAGVQVFGGGVYAVVSRVCLYV